jgi:tRNA U38,U39,U40 pseudouridine synthase TruA
MPASTRGSRSARTSTRPSTRCASTRCCPATWRSCSPTPRRTASTPAATPARARTATGCSTGARAPSGCTIGRSGITAGAQALHGTHDFTAFTPTETYHERFERDVLAAEWRLDGDLLEFWITADTFMRHMNRILVGTMLEVAAGSRSVEAFAALLDGAPRSQAGPTAPPHGLALACVGYPGR